MSRNLSSNASEFKGLKQIGKFPAGSIYKYTTGNEDLPDIYIFRNSYGAALFDLLIERSNRCVFNTMFSYTFNMAQIRQADSDYVIYCVTEWELNNIYDN